MPAEPSRGRCPRWPRKLSYTEAAARQAVDRRRNESRRGGAQRLGAFLCAECGWWHLGKPSLPFYLHPRTRNINRKRRTHPHQWHEEPE